MGLLPLVALYALFFADVPLGQPHLLYRYSPLAVLRGGAALVALAIGAIGVLSLSRWWSSDRPGARRAWACGAAAAYALLVVWTFFAPPKYAWQHLFNLQSPSHEGAFVWEARGVTSIRTYVAHGFYDRLQHRPDEMRGRRVLSNPPGMTIAIVALGRAVATMPRVQAWLQRRFGIDEVQDPTQRREFVTAIVLAMLFTLVWGGAMGFVYRLCRLWMPPPAATCVAFACIFNPSTVNFTPGKDPAQIATVALILLGWLAAYDGRGRAGAVVSGAVAAGATMFGLIHVWVAAVVAAATLWHAATGRRGTRTPREGVRSRERVRPGERLRRGERLRQGERLRPCERGQVWERVRSWGTGCALPATGGAFALAALAYAALDWNILRTAYATGVRYGQIQRGVVPDPLYWILIGVALFALFVGPMLWVLTLVARRDRHDATARLGRNLAVCTLAVMAYAYFFANNNETPRLWMPFIVLLTVSLSMRRSVFRKDSAGHRRLCLLLVGIQLTATVLHWSVMDVRESEYRLATGRNWY